LTRGRVFGVFAGAAATLLTGCESVPRPGDVVTAQVVAQPRSRAEIPAPFGALHAALRAGVERADAERGRLLSAQCLQPDTGARDGVRGRVATVLVPDGVPAPPGALLEIEIDAQVGADARPHGRFAGLAPATTPAAEPAAWARSFGRDRPLCRPAGLAEGRWRVQSGGPVAAWELGFARAELARHDSLGDAELAAGRVVQVSCRLKVVDGSDWTLVTWLARHPDGPALQVGDVVRLRAGADEGGGATGALAQVLGPAPGVRAPGGNAVVRCH
jgi:hypothetical protein